MNPVQYVGELIERVTTAVKMHGIHPRSSITVRVGNFGEEMEIEHVKVQSTVLGGKIILQVRPR
jgi:hypothetical protein